MSKLLIEGDFYIPVQQSLAAVFNNSKKAVILQQIYYWMKTYEESTEESERRKHFRDGHWWVYNTLEQWGDQFKYIMGQRMMEQYLKELINDGYLLTANYNKRGYDRTKWYSVDVDKVRNAVKSRASSHSAITAECNPQPLQNGFRNNCGDDTIEYADNSSSNNNKEIVRDFSRQNLFDKYGIPKEINIAGEEELIDGVQYFIDRYIEWSEIDHRQYTEDQWTKYITNVSNGFFFADEELTEEKMREVVDYWFDRKKVTGTMEFAQFAQPNMIQGALEVIAGKVRYRTVLNTNRELQFV